MLKKKGGIILLKMFRYVLLVTFLVAIYGLITKNFEFNHMLVIYSCFFIFIFCFNSRVLIKLKGAVVSGSIEETLVNGVSLNFNPISIPNNNPIYYCQGIIILPSKP